MEEENRRICQICYKACSLDEGETGACGVRRHVEGRLMAVGYGRVSQLALRPTEDVAVRFCRNSQILTIGLKGNENDVPCRMMTPADVLNEVNALKRHGCIGAAYMYREPLYNWEFVKDTALIVHNAGLKNILVTNGLCDKKLLGRLKKDIDAIIINWDEDICSDDKTKLRLDFIRSAMDRYHLEVICELSDQYDEAKAQTAYVSKKVASIRRGIPVCLVVRAGMGDTGNISSSNVSKLAETAKQELASVTIRSL